MCAESFLSWERAEEAATAESTTAAGRLGPSERRERRRKENQTGGRVASGGLCPFFRLPERGGAIPP